MQTFKCLIITLVIFCGLCSAASVWNSQKNGLATYYGATGAGACGYSSTDFPQSKLLVAAAGNFSNGLACGDCVQIRNVANGKYVTVKIVDDCPGCTNVHYDLSQYAFSRLSALSVGVFDTCYTVVPCPGTAKIQYRIKDGSNNWWFQFAVFNNKIPIVKVEMQQRGGSWQKVPASGVYWDASQLLNGKEVSLPVSVRITGVNGQVITSSNIFTTVTTTNVLKVPTTSQFTTTGLKGRNTCVSGCKKYPTSAKCTANTKCQWSSKGCLPK